MNMEGSPSEHTDIKKTVDGQATVTAGNKHEAFAPLLPHDVPIIMSE